MYIYVCVCIYIVGQAGVGSRLNCRLGKGAYAVYRPISMHDQRALVCASELCDRLEKSFPPPRYLPRCRRSSLPAAEPSTALALHPMAPTMGTEVHMPYIDLYLCIAGVNIYIYIYICIYIYIYITPSPNLISIYIYALRV